MGGGRGGVGDWERVGEDGEGVSMLIQLRTGELGVHTFGHPFRRYKILDGTRLFFVYSEH